MINIDTRLLAALNENEMWFLIHLAKRINSNQRTCWPSNATLLEDTGWGMEKLQKVKKALIKKKLIQVEIRKDTSNLYRITSNGIGVFIDLQSVEFEEITPDGKSAIPENQDAGKSGTPTPRKSSKEVLTSEGIISPSGEGPMLIVECYKPFIATWHSKYPLLLTMPKDGAKVKSIIRQCVDILKAEEWEISAANLQNFWAKFVDTLPRTWGHNKDLSTIDSKLKSLFLEMKGLNTGARKANWETEFQQFTKY